MINFIQCPNQNSKDLASINSLSVHSEPYYSTSTTFKGLKD
ncbi:hypothetical protein MWMV7_MWMV7_01413 [Acinetobacter calcoaceticus]|nr:hypothetical protein MWMV7_MWMV7_01413 [Acinetobacter calcoaceticus]